MESAEGNPIIFQWLDRIGKDLDLRWFRMSTHGQVSRIPFLRLEQWGLPRRKH